MRPRRHAAFASLGWASALLAAPAWSQATLPLECHDDDVVGASTVITYIDASFEHNEEDDLRKCGPSPGPWSSVAFATDTHAASVQSNADVTSEAVDVVRVHIDATLDVGDDFFDFADVGLLAEAEAFFTAPDDEVDAELVVELERESDFENADARVRVDGPSVDLQESLDDLPDGETRFPLGTLEPGEKYVMHVTSAGTLFESDSASRTIRVRVEATPVPEPAQALLACTGAALLAAARRARGRLFHT